MVTHAALRVCREFTAFVLACCPLQLESLLIAGVKPISWIE